MQHKCITGYDLVASRNIYQNLYNLETNQEEQVKPKKKRHIFDYLM